MIIQAGLGSSILYIAIAVLLAILSQADKQRKNKAAVRKNPLGPHPSGKNADIYNQIAHLLDLPVEKTDPAPAPNAPTVKEIKNNTQTVAQEDRKIENIKNTVLPGKMDYLEILEEEGKETAIKEEENKQLIENFDVKRAVIYSEILNPKY
ncbi:MAG: hypothetical protein Q8910_08215 [Bacteroidota bacterium]|nr:hypothetical protein [Bacteroidota bacterium]